MGAGPQAQNGQTAYKRHPRLIPLAVFLPVNLFALAILVVSLIGNGVALSQDTVAAATPFAAPPAYLAVRSLFVGVWLDSRGVRCVSWFWTFRYPLGAIRRLDAVNYNGVFTGGRDSFLTSMLLVTLSDGRTREIRGSISTPRAMRQEVRELRLVLAAVTASNLDHHG